MIIVQFFQAGMIEERVDSIDGLNDVPQPVATRIP